MVLLVFLLLYYLLEYSVKSVTEGKNSCEYSVYLLTVKLGLLEQFTLIFANTFWRLIILASVHFDTIFLEEVTVICDSQSVVDFLRHFL